MVASVGERDEPDRRVGASMLMYGRPVLVSLEVTLHAKAWHSAGTLLNDP